MLLRLVKQELVMLVVLVFLVLLVKLVDLLELLGLPTIGTEDPGGSGVQARTALHWLLDV